MWDKLNKQKVWVEFVFDDGSSKCIYTTMNRDILGQLGVVPMKNYLYDIENKKYYRIREDADDVIVHESMPAPRNEVDKFVRKYTNRGIE